MDIVSSPIHLKAFLANRCFLPVCLTQCIKSQHLGSHKSSAELIVLKPCPMNRRNSIYTEFSTFEEPEYFA